MSAHGVFNVRWPDAELKERLERIAKTNFRSLHAEVLVALNTHATLNEGLVVEAESDAERLGPDGLDSASTTKTGEALETTGQERSPQSVSARRPPQICANVRFHRTGVFCKTCETTPA